MKQSVNSQMLFGNVLPSQPPRPNMRHFNSLDLASETLAGYNASNQPISQAATVTPSASYVPNKPILAVPSSAIGAENFLPAFKTNHSVHETFGGSPRWEAEQMGVLPTNPRSFHSPPSVDVNFGPRQVPIRETPIIPKANLPNVPNFNGRVQKAEPITLELRAKTPTLRARDMGGLTSSMSKFGGVGQSTGRSFGSESFMYSF